MSTFIRPAFHALTLLCAACTCLVAAHAVNSVVDAWLQPLPSLKEEAPRKQRSPLDEMQTPLSLAPLARYLGLPDKLRQEVIPSPTTPGDEPTPNTLGLKLLGTMISVRPSATFASVYEGATRRTRSVWMGGDIQGAQVIAIERTRVLVLNSGRVEYIGPTATDAAPQGMDPKPPTPPAAPGSKPSIDVRQVGPQSYEISRKDLDIAIANPNELMMQARVIPAIRDGVAQGFKMFSIRSGSLYSQIGLQNGDVLQRINGLSLDSVERGLEAYQKMRESPRLELDVERNGQPVRLTYSVR
ncbi:type II secretion system protein GspC [Vitiosangium sp. GDMCC 1.1324]|uniref:type II secretion system protein GspC n=1 Tax=Vitiosangium sp. (strain GDMCC 1.1324) TaxID=2138576 RepID=UPI000D3DB042|nr:type II secretion system protein GspC [Vitiosangium sp. GDMCC 1.1324]PTL78500.1 general secretion pathway protein GspC [Vitiosangium sp. GDMCC 1.1324]